MRPPPRRHAPAPPDHPRAARHPQAPGSPAPAPAPFHTRIRTRIRTGRALAALPRTRIRTVRARAALLPALALLAACGVPPTGVVEVGTPASGLRLTHGVYFLARDEPDTLRAAPRPEAALTETLRALIEGPSRAERATLTTALPAGLPLPRLTATPSTLELRFPAHTPGLSSRAVRQLACTALLNAPLGLLASSPPGTSAPTAPGRALPVPRPGAVRVTAPGTTATLTTRERCPGLTG